MVYNTIRRIDIGSAAKIGALIYTIFAAVFGLCGLLFQGAILGTILTATSYSESFSQNEAIAGLGTAGLIGLCVGYVILVASAALFGAFTGALTAFVYNIAARWVGGLKVEVDRPGHDDYDPANFVYSADPKPKRPAAF